MTSRSLYSTCSDKNRIRALSSQALANEFGRIHVDLAVISSHAVREQEQRAIAILCRCLPLVAGQPAINFLRSNRFGNALAEVLAHHCCPLYVICVAQLVALG